MVEHGPDNRTHKGLIGGIEKVWKKIYGFFENPNKQINISFMALEGLKPCFLETSAHSNLDPLNISPNRPMTTPFIAKIMFLGPDFRARKLHWPENRFFWRNGSHFLKSWKPQKIQMPPQPSGLVYAAPSRRVSMTASPEKKIMTQESPISKEIGSGNCQMHGFEGWGKNHIYWGPKLGPKICKSINIQVWDESPSPSRGVFSPKNCKAPN